MQPRHDAYPITASGIISPLGNGLEQHREQLRLGKTGLHPSGPKCSVRTFLGAVTQPFAPLPKRLKPYETRASQMAACLVEQIRPQVEAAIRQWGERRVGIFLGSCNAGTAGTEDALIYHQKHGVWPDDFNFHRQHHFYGILHVVRELTGCTGPGSVISTACSSSSKSFATAQRLIRAGVIDAAIVGGLDTLCRLTLHGFHNLGLLSESRCQPFGQSRSGLNLGEGGALMLIERSGKGTVGLISAGESSDAFHATSPDPEGTGAIAAMKQALQRAQIEADDIGFIQSHGTSTNRNDAAEGSAIMSVFPRKKLVVASKSYTGHLLGACGIVEAVFCLISLEEGWVPNSLLEGDVDASIPVNLVRKLQTFSGRYALSNSFGFGGTNSSLVLGRLT